MSKNVFTTFVNAMLCYATKYTLVCTYEIARITPPPPHKIYKNLTLPQSALWLIMGHHVLEHRHADSLG